MRTKGIVIKIKEGKLETWKDWCHQIQTEFKKEARETMREEKCEQELFGIFQINNSWYTIGIGEGECLPSNKATELNQIHQEKKKECLDPRHQSQTKISISYQIR